MGNLLSLFWERDPPPLPLSHYNPVQDYECQKDDSCGAISEDKQDEDRGTSAPVTKDTSYQRHSKGGCWDSTQMTKKSKQNQLFAITDSEVALVNAYLEQRRVRRKVNPVQPDSETTECDSEESNSGASSWKETESEHQPSLDSVQRRKVAERHQNLGSQQIRESPCPHCKAMRTNEWLIRHFLQRASEMVPPKEDTQEEVSMRSTRSSTRRDQQEVQ
ncbi:PREDICTED: serine-rich single-pass membrane protein 1 isoform X3 [Chinchilla lanigera]|uniref:serine-rich single-pass membrane protein 1 isoform X3 n=1 Tax=Chinchilla lanigera TaxID=34839 RepID=UPI00038ECA00|nr:PREDICTED: serine-rich single-pass membrane protein 1 isoform X3 [Chinchilla lanigera]